MNNSQETSDRIASDRPPLSPPGSAGFTPLESIKQLFWPGTRPSSPPDSPTCLGTFEGLHIRAIPEIIITKAEEEGLEAKQHEQDDSDDSDETMISSYTDPEDSDSEAEDARSRWSESSSSDDGESDYTLGGNDSDSDAHLAPLPSLIDSPVIMQSAFREIIVEGGEAKFVMEEVVEQEGAGVEEEEEEDDNEDYSNDYQDGAVDDVEEEYGRPWAGAYMPRWKWLESSESLPMYNLGPTDFHHGTSKLKRASCPDDESDDDDDSYAGSDCGYATTSPLSPEGFDPDSDFNHAVISPLSPEGFDSDAQVMTVVEMVEGAETVGLVPQ